MVASEVSEADIKTFAHQVETVTHTLSNHHLLLAQQKLSALKWLGKYPNFFQEIKSFFHKKLGSQTCRWCLRCYTCFCLLSVSLTVSSVSSLKTRVQVSVSLTEFTTGTAPRGTYLMHPQSLHEKFKTVPPQMWPLRATDNTIHKHTHTFVCSVLLRQGGLWASAWKVLCLSRKQTELTSECNYCQYCGF